MNIRMIVTDVDGTLTDGRYFVSESGNVIKAFHTRDFWALRRAREEGIETFMLTSATDRCADEKSQTTGIPLVSASTSKAADLKMIAEEKGIPLEQVAYIGDAENDIAAMELCGFTACPADAVQEVKQVSNIVTDAKGGNAVVYEVVRYIFDKQELSWTE
tara:strand:- start:52020 stop:52499 length:480 start_codon:yes stop_codon:yes gene_type:complete